MLERERERERNSHDPIPTQKVVGKKFFLYTLRWWRWWCLQSPTAAATTTITLSHSLSIFCTLSVSLCLSLSTCLFPFFSSVLFPHNHGWFLLFSPLSSNYYNGNRSKLRESAKRRSRRESYGEEVWVLGCVETRR